MSSLFMFMPEEDFHFVSGVEEEYRSVIKRFIRFIMFAHAIGIGVFLFLPLFFFENSLFFIRFTPFNKYKSGPFQCSCGFKRRWLGAGVLADPHTFQSSVRGN